MYRFIEIFFSNLDELRQIYRQEFEFFSDILKYRIKIFYTKSSKFKIVLYGYDKKKKYETTLIKNFPLNIFNIIDKMPMRKYDQTIINKSTQLNFCGLSNGYAPTNHCFNDLTHQTCCLLGNQARKYADESGNPIGKASVMAFKNYYGFIPKTNTLTPWCTCIGSEVCSFYSKRFGDDGTHIKFINNYQSDEILLNHLNESKKKKKIGYPSHRTIGII